MEDPVATFMVITGCADEGLAIEFLSRADFDLGAAVSAYTAEMHGTEAASSAERNTTTTTLSASPSPPPAYHEEESVPQTHIDRVGSDFNPGVQLGVAPQNPFTVGTNAHLASVFAHPEYVVRQTSSLETVCSRATLIDHWVLVAFVDREFQSVCLPRDLWRAPQMKEIGEDYVACLEVSVDTVYGQRLAHDYRVAGLTLPRLILVDPITTGRVCEITMDPAHIDATRVVAQILTFIGENGPPSAYAAAAGRSDDEGGNAPLPISRPETIDVDAGDSECVRNTASPLHEVDSVPPSSPDAAEMGAGTSTDVVVEPVNIDAYDSQEANAFRLRARLPSSTLTMQLKQDTPVTEVIRYIAYQIHVADPTAYPVPPSIEVRTVFPPSDVTVSDPSVPVQSWPGVRSGDNVMVRIK